MPFLAPILALLAIGTLVFAGSRMQKQAQNPVAGANPGIVPTPGNTKLQFSNPTVENEQLMNFQLGAYPGTFGVSNANGNVAIPPGWGDFANPVALFNIGGTSQGQGPFAAPGSDADSTECPCDPCMSTPGLLRYAGIQAQ